MNTLTISVVIIIVLLGLLGIISGFTAERKEHELSVLSKDLLEREERLKHGRERIKEHEERQHND